MGAEECKNSSAEICNTNAVERCSDDANLERSAGLTVNTVELSSFVRAQQTQLYTPVAFMRADAELGRDDDPRYNGTGCSDRGSGFPSAPCRDVCANFMTLLDFGVLETNLNGLLKNNSKPTMWQQLFPITPLTLGDGFVIGRERVVTKSPGVFKRQLSSIDSTINGGATIYHYKYCYLDSEKRVSGDTARINLEADELAIIVWDDGSPLRAPASAQGEGVVKLATLKSDDADAEQQLPQRPVGWCGPINGKEGPHHKGENDTDTCPMGDNDRVAAISDLSPPARVIVESAGPRGRLRWKTDERAGLGRPVDRHIGRWETSPNLVPGGVGTGASQQPDGPLAGNGDFGVVVGGGRNCCGGRCCERPNIAMADLALYFGKNDFWINGNNFYKLGDNGEWWSHSTPGYLAISVGEQRHEQEQSVAPPKLKLPFTASQELATARLNATASVLGKGSLVSSTFVSTDANVVITRLRIDVSSADSNISATNRARYAAEGVLTTFTLSTPNDWQVPTTSGTVADGSGAIWLRKDACNTVDGALTLAACSSEALVYLGLRNFSADANTGEVSVFNASLGAVGGKRCLQHEPAAGSNFTAQPELTATEAWLSAKRCTSGQKTWRLADGKLTDGTNCAVYPANTSLWSTKVVSAPCAATLPDATSDVWTQYTEADGSSRLRAVHANTSWSNTSQNNFRGGACLVASPPNVNVSVALAVSIIESSTGKAVGGKLNCTTGHFGILTGNRPTLVPGRDITSLCTLKTKLKLDVEYTVSTACMSNRDTTDNDNIGAALKLVKGVDVDAHENAKDKYWSSYWSRSAVDFHPQTTGWNDIEAVYYGLLYMVGGSYAPGKVSTSHYGVYNLHDNPQCHGQLTLDYNYAAVVFGLGSANRLDLMKPVVDTLSRDDLYELGLERASQSHWSRKDGGYVGHSAPLGTQSADFGCQAGDYDDEGGCPLTFGNFSGIELPCAMGPYWGQYNNFDCALRFNAGLTATMMIDWFEFTYDQNYLDRKLWRFLAGVADFYASYAIRNTTTNELELKRTCAQEMCQQRRGTAGGEKTMTEDNGLQDLAYALMAVRKLKEYAALAKKPVKQSWLTLERDLVSFPLIRDRKSRDGRINWGTGWAEATSDDKIPPLGNTDYPIVYFAPIHPGQVVGLESEPAMLEHARNTMWAVNGDNAWHPNNGFCLGWPAAGRINGRANGTRVLTAMTAAIHSACFNNFWPNLGGGGLEQAGGLEALHSMMLQSHESCLRFFPGWPDNGTVSYEGLRARGGFTVSATQTKGKIGSINISSELGRPLSFCLPDGWAAASVACAKRGVLTPTLTNATLKRYHVQLQAGDPCIISEMHL